MMSRMKAYKEISRACFLRTSVIVGLDCLMSLPTDVHGKSSVAEGKPFRGTFHCCIYGTVMSILVFYSISYWCS